MPFWAEPTIVLLVPASWPGRLSSLSVGANSHFLSPYLRNQDNLTEALVLNMAAQQKDESQIALAKDLKNVPWCDQYERMISGML